MSDTEWFQGISVVVSLLLGYYHKVIFGPCDLYEGLVDIFVIIRTGSNELHKKLPFILNTTMLCPPHYGIWSDWEETYSGFHIANALDEIDSDLLAHHSEFEYYRRLQEGGPDGFSPKEITSWSHAPNTRFGRDTPAWKLDKWKFLPLAKKVYTQSPLSPWYMFIECDTYIFWDSLLHWLLHFDHTQPFYIGRQMNMGDSLFAYGGAGIIVSNPAMGMLVERYTSNEKFYNDFTISQWAGDVVFGKVMSDAGIGLSKAWPTLEGDMPATLDFKSTSSTGHSFWCYYATTYHHMSPYDIASYYEFEQSWKLTNDDFPRNGDVFRHLVYPMMLSEAIDWDNLSDKRETEDTSFEECLRICEARPDCVQFSLSSRTCKTSNTAKLGYKQEQPSAEQVHSGWIKRRVEAFMNVNEASCSGQQWI
ncbi:glycosyltransferase family 31 protein [Xylaria castorea]|nr:glycosyltransferase family 31 protein [Xylaria castorea]